MKSFFTLSIAILCNSYLCSAQTINVLGNCMTSITLTKLPTDVNGKNAYLGLGTVAGLPNRQVTIYWLFGKPATVPRPR